MQATQNSMDNPSRGGITMRKTMIAEPTIKIVIGVAQAPQQTDRCRALDCALLRHDRRYRHHMIGIGGVPDSEKQPQQRPHRRTEPFCPRNEIPARRGRNSGRENEADPHRDHERGRQERQIADHSILKAEA